MGEQARPERADDHTFAMKIFFGLTPSSEDKV
jgi:hypothetical protein